MRERWIGIWPRRTKNHGSCHLPRPFLTPNECSDSRESEEAKKFIVGATAGSNVGESAELRFQGAAMFLASPARVHDEVC